MDNHMLILTDAHFYGSMPKDVRRKLDEPIEESALAKLFASVSNKVGRLLHESDDDQWAIYALEEWHDVEEMLLDKIFTILISEGAIPKPPERGWHPVVVPFMERNGYDDGSGWWIECASERTTAI